MSPSAMHSPSRSATTRNDPIVQAHEHVHPLETLLPFLSDHLPYSLPLIWRLKHRTASASTAKVYATFAPGSASFLRGSSCGDSENTNSNGQDVQSAVFVDRARGPETEAWAWSSWEGSVRTDEVDRSGMTERGSGLGTVKHVEGGEVEDEEERREMLVRNQVILLLDAAASASDSAASSIQEATKCTVESPSPTNAAVQTEFTETKIVPNRRQVMILGTLSERLFRLLAGEEFHKLKEQTVISRNPPSRKQHACPPSIGMERMKVANSPNVLSGTSITYVKWLYSKPSSSSRAPFPPSQSPSSLTAKPVSIINGSQPFAPKPEAFSVDLPPDYIFSTPRIDELPLVISRTDIPRTVRTLSLLSGQGIRYRPTSEKKDTDSINNSTSNTKTPENSIAQSNPPSVSSREPEPAATSNSTQTIPETDLISWAFLGVDGSLVSLHVEAAHRGKGLAKAIALSMFNSLASDPASVGFAGHAASSSRETPSGNSNGTAPAPTAPSRAVEASCTKTEENRQPEEKLDPLTGLDISISNAASTGVVTSIGGTRAWNVRWVGVDLDILAVEAEHIRSHYAMGR